ncbi:MAG: hypothetical protein COX79_05660 [Candidatus Levybacteria bacterium CG_4_10_14_0_2_um_filter_36_16]|nr:MAG: hypothetical protein AUK12_01330 [Candidatus Levybacteria bacterium CG2_30_37_29]PIR78741.1 MAG: hypothetical protein COU26_04870 [Candidatus Levybacteria bacterium CG10_big_fil_rev_8_21_14_0_10_36_30]PIZ96156.1 MAG: hypothetical protein COX79_05660 [Candidatus Levybacteria bacterium CG_4_10_14_0_2_um_filter_36_16]
MQDDYIYPDTSTQEDVYKKEAKSFFGAVYYYLLKIEPTFIKVFNFFVYHTIRIIKSSVKFAIQQIRFGG